MTKASDNDHSSKVLFVLFLFSSSFKSEIVTNKSLNNNQAGKNSNWKGIYLDKKLNIFSLA